MVLKIVGVFIATVIMASVEPLRPFAIPFFIVALAAVFVFEGIRVVPQQSAWVVRRLEALGAIGIARVFATGASFGAGLWHPEDPWAEGRELDDKAWSLDHFERKLLRLAAGMTTAAGRRRAGARQRTMTAYLDALRAELLPGAPGPIVKT